MRIIAALFALLVSLSTAFAAGLNEKDQADIRTLVEAVMTRYNAGDTEALVEVMPQTAIELFGGRDALKLMTREAFEQQKARNLVFEKFSAGKVSEPFMAGDTTVAFVTTEVSLTADGKRFGGTGFMIASREKGSDKWQLLGGDGINRNPEVLQKVYKGFPANISLPPVKYGLQ